MLSDGKKLGSLTCLNCRINTVINSDGLVACERSGRSASPKKRHKVAHPKQDIALFLHSSIDFFLEITLF